MRIIMHIDVNNAFLSWTAIQLLQQGYKLDIRTTYAVIGGDEEKRRGIVLAKSTLAKKIGIQTAETLYSARKKCPNLKIYKGDYHWYTKMSLNLFTLIKRYTPDIEQFSIDECFLDYTPVQKLYGNPLEFAEKLQKEIYTTLGFTVNIGLANNKLCAKMASDFEKPNKIHTLYDNEIEQKMFPLPVGDLFGIGKKTVPKLNELGIFLIKDLSNANPEYLYKYFKNQAIDMIKKAKGIDNSEVISIKTPPHSISNSTTLEKNIVQKEELYPIVYAIAENICIELRHKNKYAQVVAVILKDKNFKVYSHQQKLENATNNTHIVYNTCLNLIKEMWLGEPIRLVGVRLDNLKDYLVEQISLFDKVEEKDKVTTLDKTLDTLKARYGNQIFINPNIKNVEFKKKN